MRRRIGLIVNPIAGMGGAVGLKGTDGDRAARARALGAEPLAGERVAAVLEMLVDVADRVDWLTAGGAMGGEPLAAAGIESRTVYSSSDADTNADDTLGAARALLDHDADLIVFVGGDGTATDIMTVVEQAVPILGIPAGVKMHSAVFAVTPRAAGEILRTLIETRDWSAMLEDAEIVDRPDDDASPELLGYVRTPVVPMLVAPAKAAGQRGSIQGACRRALDRIRESSGVVLIGPGMTMRNIKETLGMDAALLGVDAWHSGRQVGHDLSASAILALLDAQAGDDASGEPLLVVGVVGGQGFLFGRGNQQLSAEVLRRIGRDRLVVVSSMEKLVALPERRLYVDTGDDSLDQAMAGFIPVVTGERQVLQLAIGTQAVDAHGAGAHSTQAASLNHG